MTPIKAIETEYAGCRFRSRLEARWAVFLDHLNIGWRYEPEGFEFDGERYLPDFFLPGSATFLEVKGAQDALDADRERLHRFSRHLPLSQKIVVLGEVPDARPDRCPMHGAFWNGYTGVAIVVTHDVDDYAFAFMPAGNPVQADSPNLGGLGSWPEITGAYIAARRARFEFGESG